jgi:hypothetical protein
MYLASVEAPRRGEGAGGQQEEGRGRRRRQGLSQASQRHRAEEELHGKGHGAAKSEAVKKRIPKNNKNILAPHSSPR